MEKNQKFELLWLYVSSILIFPIIGEFIVWRGFLLEAGPASFSLIVSNIIFVAILLIVAGGVQKYKFRNKVIASKFNYPFAKKTINRSILLLILSAIIVFTLGWEILFGLSNSGEIRLSLGYFGILYTWILLYLTPAIIILNSIIYIHGAEDVKKKLKGKLFLLFFLGVLIGAFTGSKATFALLIIGGIVVLTYGRLSLKKLLLLSFAIVVGMVFMTGFTRKSNVLVSSNFLINRATVMSAYGTIAAWNLYPDGISLDDRFYNSLGIFGNNIASLVSGYPTNSVDFLRINLARLITYLVYPDTGKALSGAVNVTVTNFGEAILFFGRQLYFIYALISGLIVGITIRNFKKSVMFGLIFSGTLSGVYLFSVVIPWLNSASIWNLIGLPTAIWLFGTYIVLVMVIKIKPICVLKNKRIS